MSRDGEVVFKEFGLFENAVGSEDSVDPADSQHTDLENADSKNAVDTTKAYENLRAVIIVEREKMKNEELFIVGRKSIVNDMFNVYEDSNPDSTRFVFEFKNEDGSGDGVNRDAYTTFYNEIYELFEGNAECIPTHKLDPPKLKTLGKIITHGFLCHDVYPIKICQVSLKQQLFGEDGVAEDDLIKSFHRFLPLSDSNLFKGLENGEDISKQSIIDVLSDAGIYEMPKKENIRRLTIRAAHLQLIRKACFEMSKIVEGMGDFWIHMTPGSFDSIYLTTIPNSETFIQALEPEELCRGDMKVSLWLYRFVRSLEFEDLLNLVRFITGTHSLLPGDKIKVTFVNRPLNHLLPESRMCFKILFLPRGFLNFTDFRRDMLKAIRNEELYTVSDNFNDLVS
ncbi:uncharacterized protein [Clytia hemisphaerica]|uniref:uncharacterized protein n=1 Tax=Clytia hemisphaerica TaxID=252671 RepID=UPI0034D4A15D